MYYKVIRKYGLYEPGDLLIPTFVRKKEIKHAGYAVPFEPDTAPPAAKTSATKVKNEIFSS